MPIEWIKVSSLELEKLPKEKTVFFFPVGPLEDHGPHLPLGLDLVDAEQRSFRLAALLEERCPDWAGVLMPTAPLGLESNTTRIQITVRPHVLRDWLIDAGRSLIQMGYFHFVCVSGHPGPKQLTAIEEAGKWLNEPKVLLKRILMFRVKKPLPTLLSVSSSKIPAQKVFESPFWPDPDEHGGAKDTSIALSICPAQVGEYLDLPEIKRTSSRWRRNLLRRQKKLDRYWGNPASASPEAGSHELEKWTDEVFALLHPVWRGERASSRFRSWYSILPPNKSLFKAWLVILFIFFVMSGWCFWFAQMLHL